MHDLKFIPKFTLKLEFNLWDLVWQFVTTTLDLMQIPERCENEAILGESENGQVRFIPSICSLVSDIHCHHPVIVIQCLRILYCFQKNFTLIDLLYCYFSLST